MTTRFLITFVLALFVASDAQARKGLPEPAKNRAHVGAAWTPGSTHMTGGFDSRMTLSISMDVGGFVSVVEPIEPSTEDSWVLRHGLFVLPGVRVPHRNKSDLKWDVVIKAGFGPVWVADAKSRFDVQINPALVTGADLMFRLGNLGVRMENRVWYMKPFSRFENVEIATTRLQIGGAVQYEF
jgi:hypothetical protein